MRQDKNKARCSRGDAERELERSNHVWRCCAGFFEIHTQKLTRVVIFSPLSYFQMDQEEIKGGHSGDQSLFEGRKFDEKA